MSQLTEEERAKGVVAASAGNHAQGLAMSAKQLGVKATIVMPKTTPDVKVNNVRRLGGKVHIYRQNAGQLPQGLIHPPGTGRAAHVTHRHH